MAHGTPEKQDVRVGSEVLTSDGDLLGTVAEVRNDSFKVNAPMQADFWLASGTVASQVGSRITLRFARGQLGGYKMSGPRAA
ncbi:MAG: hypothetical protein QOF51_2373 [Chloroflexota bacterium]|jgi:hypothetical protein|nr:hypothetical protein [Chloroflexota bacterium]